MARRKRRIKEPINITFLSLCQRGINKLQVLYKADAPDGESNLEIETLCKFDDEQGEVTALVYVPEHRDTEGDIADAKVIRKAAHSLAKNGFNMDLTHDGKKLSRDQAFIAESWIVPKGDSRFDGWEDYEGNPVDATGGWAVVVKVDDPDLRARYKSGDWNGVSMFGVAAVEVEKAETGPAAAADLFTRRSQEKIMDETKFEAMLKKFGETLLGGITKALKPEPKTEPKPKPEEPVKKAEKPKIPEGLDINDPRAVEEHLRKARAEAVDWNDPKAVEDYLADLQKGSENLTEIDKAAGVEDGDDDEVKELKRKLFKAKKASKRAPVKKTETPEDDPIENLSKSEADEWAAGLEMAEAFNKESGFGG